ncbi:MAG: ATP-binding protein, partial [Zetaproteobacteria bacterium]|nr:ATP-binding protein [Zetaproteobacteria bacterium]
IYTLITTRVTIKICSELLSFQAKLNALVEEKTDTLTKLNRKLQKTAENKSRFLANMSHEIRTPLGGILGISELALHEGTTQEQQIAYLNTIHESGAQLMTLVNDVLDFSKIESGKLVVESKPFEVRKFVNESITLFRSQVMEKGLGLEIEISCRVPDVVVGDEHRIRQVLFNLLGNAIKFTAKGRIRIFLDAEPHQEACMLRFSIEDTGIGMSAQDATRIFQSFTQAEASTTRRFGGTGLGLAICKGLVESMGGDISVKSEVGHGSCFTFTVSAREGFMIQNMAEAKSLAPFHFKVLLAEDNPINIQVTKSFLQILGCTVDVVLNGKEAVAAVHQQKYDICFMDCQMPVMDGFNATRAIKSEVKECPFIVALTANALQGDRDKCLAAGMDEYISKPINKRNLAVMLQKYHQMQQNLKT